MIHDQFFIFSFAHPHISSGCKIERQNTGESIDYDVTNRNIASLQRPFFTPMTYGHERYMKDKKEEYLWLKETKDIKRNGKKVLDGRR